MREAQASTTPMMSSAHHEEFVPSDLHGLAGVFAEQHEDLAVADCEDFALIGLSPALSGD